MENLAHLFEAERLVLDKLSALIGAEHVDHIVSHGSGALRARIEAFI